MYKTSGLCIFCAVFSRLFRELFGRPFFYMSKIFCERHFCPFLLAYLRSQRSVSDLEAEPLSEPWRTPEIVCRILTCRQTRTSYWTIWLVWRRTIVTTTSTDIYSLMMSQSKSKTVNIIYKMIIQQYYIL